MVQGYDSNHSESDQTFVLAAGALSPAVMEEKAESERINETLTKEPKEQEEQDSLNETLTIEMGNEEQEHVSHRTLMMVAFLVLVFVAGVICVLVSYSVKLRKKRLDKERTNRKDLVRYFCHLMMEKLLTLRSIYLQKKLIR